MRPPPLPHQSHVLRSVLERVQQTIEAGRNPVVVFDLDATLYDNRPRTLEILMEYREEVFESHPDVAEALGVVTAERIEYLLSDSLRGCGITRSDIVQDITRFWRERFFTDEYVQRDTTIDGAAEYVQACHEAGAIIVYMTGRDVPGMLLGTVASLRDCGFPIGVAGIELVLKPDANLPDEAFKRGALPTLDRLGEMVAFFDNEPANCNLARSMFPESLVVLLETQRVPYAPPLAEDIEVVADFRIG
jgi:hypothetical protein